MRARGEWDSNNPPEPLTQLELRVLTQLELRVRPGGKRTLQSSEATENRVESCAYINSFATLRVRAITVLAVWNVTKNIKVIRSVA